jgi:hypothetical protein
LIDGGLERLHLFLTAGFVLIKSTQSFRVAGGHKIKTPPPTTADEQHQRLNGSTAGGGPGVGLAPDYINPCYRTWADVPPVRAMSDNCPVDYVRRRKGHDRPLSVKPFGGGFRKGSAGWA